MLISPVPFRRALLTWYRTHGRDLPWRKTRDPYAILVSEVMLQQTQVATVLPYYNEWIRRFPDFPSLAAAPESDVLHAWQGLGYYARARNLHATARGVNSRADRAFPDDIERMRELPGLGRYTANAVATFAFNRSVPLVEANIGRLLARLINLQAPIDSAAGNEQLWRLASTLIPKCDARTFNSALMDFGALICVARHPKCSICPLRNFCRAVDPARLPLKKKRAARKMLTEHHVFALNRGQILLEQSQHRWRRMWILPQLLHPPGIELPLYTSEFPFTHHWITLAVYRRSTETSIRTATRRWFSLESLDSIPLPSPHRRAVTHLIAHEPQKLCSTLAAT